MDFRPKFKCKAIKLLENNIGQNLDDFGHGNEFLDTTLTVWPMKERINKPDFLKMKTCAL